MSQRELARAVGVSTSTIGRIEAESMMPSLPLFLRIVGAAEMTIAVVDAEGHVLQPMLDSDDIVDGAERRYPAHLDVILDPVCGEWWADRYGLLRPPETFRRDRRVRDDQRRRSQWEVRVAKYRNDPEPPDPTRPSYRPRP
jgi:transcriptional regulator with XRE-family HTH domain